MRKMTSLLLAAGMTMALLSGCGGGTEAKETTAAQTTAAETRAEETTAAGTEAAESRETETAAAEVKAPEKDVEMQYMSVEDAHGNLGKDGYTFLDVRKAEDHKTSCVPCPRDRKSVVIGRAHVLPTPASPIRQGLFF